MKKKHHRPHKVGPLTARAHARRDQQVSPPVVRDALMDEELAAAKQPLRRSTTNRYR